MNNKLQLSITNEELKVVKQAITIAYKLDALKVDIEFLKYELEEVLKHSIYNKVAEISLEINKKAKQVLKLQDTLKENKLISDLYEVVKHELFAGEFDWKYVANRYVSEIEDVLFQHVLNNLNKRTI